MRNDWKKVFIVETNRLDIHATSRGIVEDSIEGQTVEELKAAHMGISEEVLKYPEQREWYAIWMIELEGGIHIGELSFKGMGSDGVVEVGYGISAGYRGDGYATGAVPVIMHWVIRQSGVTRIEIETDFEDTASQRMLEKYGFTTTGCMSAEGPRSVWLY